MRHGSLLERLTKGTRWIWLSEDYRGALPADLPATVMDIQSTDRLHAKQGRSTARVRFDSPWGPLSVYLKRHTALPWTARLAALVDPSGRHSPAAAEFAHLEEARKLGVAVPEVVAAGETIGPWGRLQSFLMVAELTGRRELNELLPSLKTRLGENEFTRLKRELIVEMAEITARLHRESMFHKDLYLCHFFLDEAAAGVPGKRLTLIDLHRLGRHRRTAFRWRRKDLGQLLYSTIGMDGIDDRDRLRFWMHYRKRTGLKRPDAERRAVIAKAGRYLRHNR
jgi:heptose I phosphotransferase